MESALFFSEVSNFYRTPIFENPEIEPTKQALTEIRHEHFAAKTANRKSTLRQKDKELREKLARLLAEDNDFAPDDAKQLADWNPYDQNAVADFFDPEWMFGVSDGFDIVIGNPPILRGRDIKRYGYNWANLWLINTHNGIRGKLERIHIEDYPAVKAHLDHYWDRISKRADKGDTPYNLRNCAYLEDFSKPKIVWGNLNLRPSYAIVEDNSFINAPSPMIVPASRYLLAILNSKLADYFIRQLGVTRNGGYFEYKPMFIEQLPVPQCLDDSILKEINTNATIKNEKIIDK